MPNETEPKTESKSFFSDNLDSIVCTIGFLLIIRFGNLAIGVLSIIAYLAFVVEFVSRKEYRLAYRILTIISVLTGIFMLVKDNYFYICSCILGLNLAAYGLIKIYIVYERNKLFDDNCWQIVEKYNEASALLNKHKGLDSYKKLINNIYKEDKNLYLSSVPVREALNKVNNLISAMNNDESFKPKKKLFVKDDVETDKQYNTNKYMKAALEKQKQYSDYIEEVDNAIKATGTDFLNVRAELELADLSSVDMPEPNISKLEQRSKTLAYIQSHLPILN